jgi:phosphatidylinositol-3-phosphatase
MKKLSAVAALAAAAIAALVTVQIAGATGGRGHDEHRFRDVRHVFVIMLENHSQQSVIGDPNAPYITSLAQHYASAAEYYGVTHPSEPNYLALLSGSNWWLNKDDPSVRLDHVNLVDELEAAHKTWAAYMEAMPADNKTVDAWPSSSNALYASKHNPFVLFNDIRNSSTRMANVKPYTDFATDLASAHTTPDFAFIAPDQCNDMHGGVYTAVPGHPETPCPYNDTNDDPNDVALKQKADAFVQRTVQTIMASPSWHQGQDAIFVVSDEGDYTGNSVNGGFDSPAGCCDSPVLPAGDPDINAAWPGGVYGGGLVPAVVVVNRGGKTGGYVSDTPYNHYSLLATIEDFWRLPRLAYAADTAQVTPMTEFFTR